MEEGLPQPNFEIPLPNTDVSFGVTPSFAKSFPDEVDTQLEKFNRPTWQTRTAQNHAAVAEVAKAPAPAFFPSTPKAAAPPPKMNPSSFAYLRQGDGRVLLGMIFFAGIAYLIARGVQWHFLSHVH